MNQDNKEKVIIVDMINGFTKEGPLADKGILNIVNKINELIKLKNKAEIIFLNDSHNEDSLEFNAFPKHCLKGSNESKIIDELMYLCNKNLYDFHVVNKNSTNGFYKLFEGKHIENNSNYYICGCCYDICVLNLALSLITYFHEYNYNSNVYVINDACDTFDTGSHSREKYIGSAKNLLNESGVKIINLEDLKE